MALLSHQWKSHEIKFREISYITLPARDFSVYKLAYCVWLADINVRPKAKYYTTIFCPLYVTVWVIAPIRFVC